jgi:3-hydroxyisobutyrate dehydrogenase-like beta-hydroxyacid dehydrogenase
MTIVAIPAAGAMGAAVGARLVRHGVEVRSLAGRSPATVARAKAAGMTEASPEGIAAADIVLSIVPPDQALALAEALAPALTAARRKPVFADCNAVSPATVGRIAAAIAATGCPFADAGIIGLPPREGAAGPAFYASGPGAGALAALQRCGIDVRVMAAPVGAASALKLSYAGITKGLVALGAAMTLAAIRGGVAEALRAELATSQPALRAGFARSLPDMLDKAARWAPELEEIAAFVGPARPESAIYRAAARFYAGMADLDAAEREALRSFWSGTA